MFKSPVRSPKGMGLFDTINANLTCPETRKTAVVDIQIKWQDMPGLNYHTIGDRLPYVAKGRYWVRKDYLCDTCSTRQSRAKGEKRAEGAYFFHDAYIHLTNSTIAEVLSEEEFFSRYRTRKRLHLPKGEVMVRHPPLV